MSSSRPSGSSDPSADSAATLEFLASLEQYVPTIPDEITNYYLARSGFQSPDTRLTRLVSVAAQKFVADVANDALQYCKIRQQQQSQNPKDKKAPAGAAKDKRLVLTMEDLSDALKEYGVNVHKQEYVLDSLEPPSSKSVSLNASFSIRFKIYKCPSTASQRANNEDMICP
eukprot:jgi/Mesvir1/8648/Mv02592-RA.1